MEIIKKSFEHFTTNDPKIIINGENINIYPLYWNYSFISNLVPLPIFIFILIESNDFSTDIMSLFGLTISLFTYFKQLNFYNSLTINLTESILIVTPNLFLRLITPRRKIDFKQIVNTFFESEKKWHGPNRYIIKISIEGDHKISLISTRNEKTATELCSALNGILKG
jgi:hypothetical protein